MPLDPGFEAMLKELAAAGGPAPHELAPADARKMYQAMPDTRPAPDLWRVESALAADRIPVRIYQPTDGLTPCVVFFHGGGWVLGDIDTHDAVCRQLASATDATIVSVDYRLAPEAPFPAALDDCHAAVQWVRENADKLNIDATRLAVAGDSAGGNLAASVCLKTKTEGKDDICFQLLIYPVTDYNFDTPSYEENAEGYMLTRDMMRWFWHHYVGHDESEGKNPLASPLQASDLRGLPPAFVMTAEFDPLRDEGEAYAQALQAAGVETEMKRYNGMIHGFFGQTHIAQGAQEALEDAASALRRVLNADA